MIRSFFTVSSGTLASRLLGFARDSMIAALLGTGAVADAFLVAFQLVNVVRRLLSEGALNAALVPAWLRLRDAEGEEAAARFAGRVLGTVSAVLIAVTVLIGLAMPFVIIVLAPGFAGRETLQFAIDNARLMLPYLAFAGPVTVMMALLNAQGRFTLTAFSPLLFNIALIGVMVVLLFTQQSGAAAAQVIAATVGVAGLLQLLILVLRRHSSGNRTATPLRIAFDGEMRGFFRKAVPGMIASAGPQLLIVLSEPIVRMLFEHGAFTAEDTAATSRALMWLALGLPAHVLVKALSPAFFARGDTATPLWATLTGIAVAIAAALVFGRLFGADGIAAAIALGAWSTALALIRRGAVTFGFAIDADARRRLPRIAVSALAMGGLLWLAARFALAVSANGHTVAQAAILLALICAAMTVYGLLLALSGAARWDEAVGAIRQPAVRDLRD